MTFFFFEKKKFRPGKSCGVGELIIFLAVMRCLFYFVCGVAVFRTLHVPLLTRSSDRFGIQNPPCPPPYEIIRQTLMKSVPHLV